MATKIDWPLHDEIRAYPYLSAPPKGGRSTHLWKSADEPYVRYRPICGRMLVMSNDSVIIGRTVCLQCLKVARAE